MRLLPTVRLLLPNLPRLLGLRKMRLLLLLALRRHRPHRHADLLPAHPLAVAAAAAETDVLEQRAG